MSNIAIMAASLGGCACDFGGARGCGGKASCMRGGVFGGGCGVLSTGASSGPARALGGALGRGDGCVHSTSGMGRCRRRRSSRCSGWRDVAHTDLVLAPVVHAPSAVIAARQRGHQVLPVGMTGAGAVGIVAVPFRGQGRSARGRSAHRRRGTCTLCVRRCEVRKRACHRLRAQCACRTRGAQCAECVAQCARCRVASGSMAQ